MTFDEIRVLAAVDPVRASREAEEAALQVRIVDTNQIVWLTGVRDEATAMVEANVDGFVREQPVPFRDLSPTAAT